MTQPDPIRRAVPDAATLSTWTAPDGWPLRRFDWPNSRGRGRLMIQGGRGDPIEKHLETFGHFHRQGWSITAFDWRGQGGSGRLSADPHVGHADDFTPWIADLAALWRDWSAAGDGPRGIIGHSMGGYLALRAMVEGAIDPDAAVLVAPMLGLRSPVGERLGARIAGWMVRYRDPATPAWRDGKQPVSLATRRHLLTGDASRYADEGWWHERNPTIRLGPPSWGWLAEAFAATRALVADPRLDTLPTPTLLLVAEADGLVDPRATIRVARRLPRGELIRFGRESAHEILREADPVRDRALAAIDTFLDVRARP
ncbi:alpha/beta fold hydrolase [Sphingomonas bacterium]|uniref:alpha/beta fold hydrolase n=1 Tax=Sphingomonas bacterium TaxID=1895847 RepID=UPI0015762C34|nr:alpha/beta hydrolase [Sphingomonas bacterium]